MNAVARKSIALAPLVFAVTAAGNGCKSKKSGPAVPDVVGLAAIPATADVVISVDVPATSTAPLVQRAATQLLLRDATLADRWQQLRTACKIEPESISQATLAWGSTAASGASDGANQRTLGSGASDGANQRTLGSGASDGANQRTLGSGASDGANQRTLGSGGRSVLMVVTGSSLNESSFAPCVRGLVGKGGGTLTGKPVGGRTIYYAKEGERGVWFGFGSAHTVVVGSNESFVVDALGSGPKIASNPAFSQWMSMVASSSPMWAVGRLDPRVGEGLVRASGGKLSAGPTAFVLSAALTNGLQASLQVVMKHADDAKGLESFAKAESQLLAMAAQWKNLGPLASKLTTSVKSNVVRLAIDWNNDDLNQLLSVIDSAPPSNETAPGAGVTPAPVTK